MIHSIMSIGVTSAQVHTLFREFIIVTIVSYYFHWLHTVFTSASALIFSDLDPNVSKSRSILQVTVQIYFISQLLPDRMFLTFLFDLFFHIDEILGRREQHDVLLHFWGQPIPVALRENWKKPRSTFFLHDVDVFHKFNFTYFILE